MNVNYLLLTAMLVIFAALANLVLRATQKSRRSALPG